MSATEAQAEAAIVILERMIDAARNGNQAGEDAVVAAAEALNLLAALKSIVRMGRLGLDDFDMMRAEAAIARATGAA